MFCFQARKKEKQKWGRSCCLWCLGSPGGSQTALTCQNTYRGPPEEESCDVWHQDVASRAFRSCGLGPSWIRLVPAHPADWVGMWRLWRPARFLAVFPVDWGAGAVAVSAPQQRWASYVWKQHPTWMSGVRKTFDKVINVIHLFCLWF